MNAIINNQSNENVVAEKRSLRIKKNVFILALALFLSQNHVVIGGGLCGGSKRATEENNCSNKINQQKINSNYSEKKIIIPEKDILAHTIGEYNKNFGGGNSLVSYIMGNEKLLVSPRRRSIPKTDKEIELTNQTRHIATIYKDITEEFKGKTITYQDIGEKPPNENILVIEYIPPLENDKEANIENYINL